MKRDFIRGLRHGVPIALGYLSVSFTFGMKAVADGMTPLQAVLISATNLTSAGQFAGLPLMLSSASLMEMALTQLIINLRYALMSLSLSQKLDESMNTLSRMLFSFANTDEFRRCVQSTGTCGTALFIWPDVHAVLWLDDRHALGRGGRDASAGVFSHGAWHCDLRHVPCDHSAAREA